MTRPGNHPRLNVEQVRSADTRAINVESTTTDNRFIPLRRGAPRRLRNAHNHYFYLSDRITTPPGNAPPHHHAAFPARATSAPAGAPAGSPADSAARPHRDCAAIP